MKIVIKNCNPAEYPRVGLKTYIVRHTHIHTGEVKYTFPINVPRTNMSREPREKGWLGTTNDVQADALGFYELVSFQITKLKRDEKVTLVFKEISN